jgi:hypothetical protein
MNGAGESGAARGRRVVSVTSSFARERRRRSAEGEADGCGYKHDLAAEQGVTPFGAAPKGERDSDREFPVAAATSETLA